MSTIHWKDEYALGLPPMDDTHREFIAWLHRLEDMPDAEFPAGTDGFIAHTADHFAQEDRWIKASGFPAEACHTGMHEEILAIARFVREKVAEGNLALGRKLVAELATWFETHAATMDNALATWIRETGFNVAATTADPHSP